jgi:repressor LexA
MKPLTVKQKRVLSAISDLTQKNGSSPTFEQLRVYLNYSRISSVQRHTDALKEKGYLDKSRSLSIPILNEKVRIPLVGNIACGSPLLATQNIEAYVAYKKSLLKGDFRDYFFLRALGDSMDKANVQGKTIDDGDFVLVKRQNTADFGEKIVALMGDEATIKYLQKEKGYIVLNPKSSNPENKPIYVLDDLLIQGIVVDVIKKGGKND